MADASLSISEKRAILASWASDASAIASCPALRTPEGLKAPVSIDDILEALRALDDGPRHPPGGKPMPVNDDTDGAHAAARYTLYGLAAGGWVPSDRAAPGIGVATKGP